MKITNPGGDGMILDTRFFDDEGRDITHDLCVRSVRFEHQVGEVPVAVLECLGPEVDVVVRDEFVEHELDPDLVVSFLRDALRKELEGAAS